MTHRQPIHVSTMTLVLRLVALAAMTAVFWIGVWTVLGWVF